MIENLCLPSNVSSNNYDNMHQFYIYLGFEFSVGAGLLRNSKNKESSIINLFTDYILCFDLGPKISVFFSVLSTYHV